MGVLHTYKLACDVEGCTNTATIDVPVGDTVYGHLADGWAFFASETEHRVRCDDSECVTAAAEIQEAERLVRAAARSSKTKEQRAAAEAENKVAKADRRQAKAESKAEARRLAAESSPLYETKEESP